MHLKRSPRISVNKEERICLTRMPLKEQKIIKFLNAQNIKYKIKVTFKIKQYPNIAILAKKRKFISFESICTELNRKKLIFN